MKQSKAAESITTSPILVIAAEINKKIQQGEKIFNLTVGDFNSQIYPIPDRLTELTIDAYNQHETNYPGAFGIDQLRQAIIDLLKDYCEIDVSMAEVQVASGSRPLIYSFFKTIVDPGEKVIFPVPSWNNDYYTEMHSAEAVIVETSPESNFFPTAESLRPVIKDAVLLSLCSPQNPTGTILDKQQLIDICDLVVEENKRRSADEKPLYVMFDQVYWLLTFGNSNFYHPLAVCPAIKPYAVFIDGISKSLAGTGVRVGWATGPEAIIAKMRAFIAHIGAWAPKPEQIATGLFLAEKESVNQFLTEFRGQLQQRLDGFYQGFMALKEKGYDVDAIAPQAAIYLSIRLNLKGKKTVDGRLLETDDDVHQYLLNEVGIGVLPFSWFGADTHADWYRISVGTSTQKQVEEIMSLLESSLQELK
ncbi:MAG: pyridoxal phosphate-dependent aminotransferase [Thiotrichaceae bacterium]|nr:pyridoxal phosphate-dependent aminotransferase [Thiotrichaceae bacterium]